MKNTKSVFAQQTLPIVSLERLFIALFKTTIFKNQVSVRFSLFLEKSMKQQKYFLKTITENRPLQRTSWLNLNTSPMRYYHLNCQRKTMISKPMKSSTLSTKTMKSLTRSMICWANPKAKTNSATNGCCFCFDSSLSNMIDDMGICYIDTMKQNTHYTREVHETMDKVIAHPLSCDNIVEAVLLA